MKAPCTIELTAIRYKWFRTLTSVAGLLIVMGAIWAGYLRLTGNFHAVEPGIIYRSGQLNGAQFAARIAENGLRTIVNLRGNNSGQRWYDDEVRSSDATGVRHIDFPISAGRELTDDEIDRLTALLRDSPRPILIHCEAGADRSGFVAALYELSVANRSPDEARAQLSFRYGHFPWLGNSTAAMDRTLERVLSRYNPSRKSSPQIYPQPVLPAHIQHDCARC
jgi:protein tyrosine/serine phosphatase